MLKPPPPRCAGTKDVLQNMSSVCIGLTSAFMVQTMLLIAVPLYSLELGASPFLIGVILSAPYLLPLLFAIPMAGTVARAGGRKVLIAGGTGMTLAPWLILGVPGYGGLVAAQLVVGLAQIVMVLAAQSIISELGSGKRLEKYFGWYTTCLSGGQLVGPLLAGWLIDAYSLELSFAVMGAVSIVSLASGFFLVGRARTGQRTKKSLLGYRAQGRLLKTNPGVQVSIAVTVAAMFALGAYGSFLPVYLEDLAISAMAIGALVSLRAFCAMAVRPFMSSVIMLVGGRSRAMVLSIACVATGLMFTGFTGDPFVLGMLAVLVGVGSGVSQPLSMVVLVEHVPPPQRSSALAMRLMGNRGVQFLAPLMLGFLAEAATFKVTFFVGSLFIFVCLILIVYILRDSLIRNKKRLNDVPINFF